MPVFEFFLSVLLTSWTVSGISYKVFLYFTNILKILTLIKVCHEKNRKINFCNNVYKHVVNKMHKLNTFF